MVRLHLLQVDATDATIAHVDRMSSVRSNPFAQMTPRSGLLGSVSF